jgi:O-phospho-L-seryl-tRNASec:L-selenocysteinyl-tRNA synthase
MCSALDVGHVINNAYGIQAAQLCKEVTRAWRRGRVDAVVQSTDKNFMVPVGGAVVCSGKEHTSVVDAVRKSYPGRASISPVLDLLITLLSMGADGWARCLAERQSVYGYMQTKLGECVREFGERLLETPGNPISMGVSLERHAGLVKDGDVSFFGSMLFSRCVSGTRVVAPGKRADVGGVVFDGFGASHDAYPVPYFTAAAALGTTEADVDRFCAQLKKCFKDFRKKAAKRDGEGGTDKGDEGVDALDAAADQLARVNL